MHINIRPNIKKYYITMEKNDGEKRKETIQKNRHKQNYDVNKS